MSLQIVKPWLPLDADELARLGAQLGVYELADRDQKIVYIGVADARSRFGLRGELEQYLGTAAFFRCEVNTAYATRHRELLMHYFALNQCYPERNSEAETRSLGRLS